MTKKSFLPITALLVSLVFVLTIAFVFFGDSDITYFIKKGFYTVGIRIPSVVWKDNGSIVLSPSFEFDDYSVYVPADSTSRSGVSKEPVKYDQSFLEVYYDTVNSHFGKNLQTDFNYWTWTKDIVIAEVLGVNDDLKVLGVTVTFPTNRIFSDKPLVVPLRCPVDESYIVNSLNLELVESSVDIFSKVEKGDIIYSRCGDKDCSFFEYGCVLVKRGNESE